jgi:TonB-linked SusC/RagA family outer membrane protein
MKINSLTHYRKCISKALPTTGLKICGLTPAQITMRIYLSFFLVMSLFVQISAASFGQKVTLSAKNASIGKLFSMIKKQTGYNFVYTSNLMDDAKPITINVKDVELEEALNKCFEGQNFNFIIEDKTIIVRPTTATNKIALAIIDVLGTVTDDKGLPLPGATVKIKNTEKLVLTDGNGNFKINANIGDILTISYTGFIPQEITVSANTSKLMVKLAENNQVLDNVVVVGYGTQTSAKVTGAISTVKMDEVLRDRPVSNTTQLLQSSVPGLQINVGTGKPGESGSINLRGATSLNSSDNTSNTFLQTGPLILIDNVPLNGSLSQLDPNDIETITVLKDAGSAAIYGARSAFGVILVTTKKGKANQKPQFNYSNNIIFASPTNLPVQATPEQFLQSLKDMGTIGYWSLQNVDTWIQLYEDAKVNPDKYPNGLATSGTTLYPVRKGSLIDGFLGKNVPQFQNNFSVTGGTDKVTYRLALGTVNENGVIVPEAKQDYYKRYNIKSFINADVNKWLTTQLDAQYFNSITSSPANQPFGALVTSQPLMPTDAMIPASNGNVGKNSIPKYAVIYGSPNIYKTSDIRVTGRAILKPIKDLTITGEYTYDKLAGDSTFYNKSYPSVNPYNFQEVTSGNGVYKLANNGTIYKALNIFGNYTKNFGEHHFSALAGFNKEESIYQRSSIARNGMISSEFPSINNATGPIDASNYYTDFSLSGLFWRLNYDYKNKYLVQVNQRYDGSSKFPKNHRFGLFPSASIGWVVTEENFVKENVKLLSTLKLRASLGEVGNQAIDPYRFTPTLPKYQPYWLNGTGSYLTSLNSPELVSSDFTWETVRTLNLGVDFAFLKNRLSGTFDWYIRDTKNILGEAVPLPAVLGADAPLQNTASLRSKGYEVTIAWQDKIGKDWSYNIGGNLYDFTSNITKVNNNDNNLLDYYYVGQQLGEIWGYTSDRLYTVDDFEAGSLKPDLTGGTLKKGIPTYGGITPNPGDVLLKDLNGDGKVLNGVNTLSDPGDRSVIGNSTLRYQYGINGGVSYKSFDFSFVLRGVGKSQYYVANTLTQPNWGGFSAVIANTLDYWTPTNVDAFYARLYDKATGNQGYNQNTIQTRYLLNGAYLKVANLALGYNLPKTLLSKFHINSLRVFCSVENPFNFNHLPQGLDPSLDNLGSGVGYPFLRKTSFGVNITL